MDTINEQRELIEKLVKSNNKFKGNEDLIEDFCSETYKRSYSLFDNVNIKDIENYIAKVVNTAILTVLKPEIVVEKMPEPAVVYEPFVYDIADPRDSFEEKVVRKDLLQKIVDIVLIAQKENPSKEFLKIFYLRYIKEFKQKEIAEEVNISQAEVSKRLIEILRIVKSHF